MTRLVLLGLAALSLCSAAEILTLEQAVQLAARNNRSLKNATLEVNKASDRNAALRTRLLPNFKLYALGSQLLTPVDFTVLQGQFGTFPNIGPIPATDTRFRTPLRPTALVIGSVAQPLSTLYSLHLSLKLSDLNSRVAEEQARSTR